MEEKIEMIYGKLVDLQLKVGILEIEKARIKCDVDRLEDGLDKLERKIYVESEVSDYAPENDSDEDSENNSDEDSDDEPNIKFFIPCKQFRREGDFHILIDYDDIEHKIKIKKTEE